MYFLKLMSLYRTLKDYRANKRASKEDKEDKQT